MDMVGARIREARQARHLSLNAVAEKADILWFIPTHGDGRDWQFCDDPAHAWIRDTWAGVPIDPRLPMTGGTT